jgi:hypothetical protein
MNLKEKLIKVSDAIGYLQKDKKNSMQGYSYLSEAKIKEVIQQQFVNQRIVFNYSTDEVREYEISPTSKGTRQFVTVACGTYSLIDVDSEEKISGKWYGSGSDTGDKGLYKAITGGIKYVLNTNFLIPTGDDPENDDDKTSNGNGKSDTPKIKPKDEYSELKKTLMKKHNGNKEAAKAEFQKIMELQKVEAELTSDDKSYIDEQLKGVA